MHVAVLGGGYAGVALARELETSLPSAAEVTLVDEDADHVVQHLIHTAIRKPSAGDALQVSFDSLLTAANHRQTRVQSVDADAGRVELADGTLEYDFGAVCLGARTAFHGLEGVRAHATPLKRLEHAATIRERALTVCADGGRIVVGGAGLAGVQVAGELQALARERDASERVDVVLLEREPEVAPSFPAPFQRALAEELERAGVEVRTGRTVTSATPDTVRFADSENLTYDQLVWTGGITGRDAVGDRRPEVRADLRLGQRTVAAGDAVRVVDANGQAVPASAQTALGQADVAAENLARLADGENDGFEPRLARYRYSSRGWMVTVGDGAVAQVGSNVLRGRAAKAFKTTVGASYLQEVAGLGGVSDLLGHSEKSSG